MNRGYFITGTDTEIGKTWTAAALIAALRAQGKRVAPMKPVASGCEGTSAQLRSDDALALAAAAHSDLPYKLINPYPFTPPIAPHIAAAEAAVEIDLDKIIECFRRLQDDHDAVVVEGVGGWCVPLGPGLMLADLARRLQLPVILVVGMRLGCISHALLSAQRIVQDGLTLSGWVANECEPQMARFETVLDTLKEAMQAPLLGKLPYNPALSPDQRGQYLNLPY